MAGTIWNPDDWDEGGYKFKPSFKASTLITYRNDAVLQRSYRPACAGTVTASCGTVGSRPSKRSLQRLVFILNNCDVPMQSMLTITMQKEVSRRNSVSVHRKTLSLALQRLRDTGVDQYVWVREFQEKTRSVHWHIFVDSKVSSKKGGVNKDLSKRWSRWMVNRYQRSGWCSDSAAHKMMMDAQDGFVGCCRFERLRKDAAGSYAGKEGSKRFQKRAPKRWQSGGRWWAASQTVVCTPTGTKKVSSERLSQATIRINGKEFTTAHKIQFGMGMKLASTK